MTLHFFENAAESRSVLISRKPARLCEAFGNGVTRHPSGNVAFFFWAEKLLPVGGKPSYTEILKLITPFEYDLVTNKNQFRFQNQIIYLVVCNSYEI